MELFKSYDRGVDCLPNLHGSLSFHIATACLSLVITLL